MDNVKRTLSPEETSVKEVLQARRTKTKKEYDDKKEKLEEKKRQLKEKIKTIEKSLHELRINFINVDQKIEKMIEDCVEFNI